MKIILYLSFLVGLIQTAVGQPQLGRIYHTTNPDSSIAIVGENHGFVPYTVSLSAKLVNMHSTKRLPAKFVVFPSKEPCLITTLIPDRKDKYYSFHYEYPYQLGLYTGRMPDTTYVYRLPFKLNPGDTIPPCSTDNTKVPGNRYPYFFSLRAGTAICAARAGIVVTFKQDVTKAKGVNTNYIIVFQEDGTLAWYQNIQKNSVPVTIGQRVAEGDVLGYASGEKQHPPLYFDIEYPGEKFPQAVPVIFRVGDTLLRLHKHRGQKLPTTQK